MIIEGVSKKTIIKLFHKWLMPITFLPLTLRRLPYSIGLIFIRLSAKFGLHGSQNYFFFPRNSYCTGAIIPGLSDLDLGVVCDKEDFNFEHLNKFFKKCKKILPYLGETNIYSKELIKEFEVLINPFELDRDPYLNKFITHNDFKALDSKASQLVFLLKMVEADLNNLKKWPGLRRLKWESHFKSIGIDITLNSKMDLNTIIQSIKKNYFDLLRDRNYLNVFLSYCEFNGELNCFQEANTVEFFVLFPNRWLGPALHRGKFQIELAENIKQIGSLEVEILLSNLDWEIWGLLHQRYFLKKENLYQHLENIKKVITLLNNNKNEIRLDAIHLIQHHCLS